MNIRDHPFLYQWDTNRYLDIPEADAVYVDFARTGEEPLRIAVADGGVRIPDSWLQTAGNQNIYVCYVDGTLRGYTLRIVPRPKPPDYVATPDEAQSYAKLEKKLSDEVSRLDDRINNIQEGTGGASAWSEITDKPFNTIDGNTLVNRSGALCVNTTDDAEQDNTRPITSSGVHVVCGNINALLQSI